MAYEEFLEKSPCSIETPEWFQNDVLQMRETLKNMDDTALTTIVDGRTMEVFNQYDSFQKEVRSSYYIVMSPIVAIGALVSVAHELRDYEKYLFAISLFLLFSSFFIARSTAKSLRIKFQQYVSANVSATIVRSAVGQNDNPWFHFTELMLDKLKPDTSWNFVNAWVDCAPNIFTHNVRLIKAFGWICFVTASIGTVLFCLSSFGYSLAILNPTP